MALVQSVHGGTGSGTGVNPFTVTSSAVSFPSPTTAGNLLVCVAWSYETFVSGGLAPSTAPLNLPLGDSALTWGNAGQVWGTSDQHRSGWVSIFYVPNAPSTSAAFTVGAKDHGVGVTVTIKVEFSLYEFNAITDASPRETAAFWMPSSGGTLTTANTDLIISAFSGDPLTGSNVAAGSGYTLGINATSTSPAQMQYQLAATPGLVNVRFATDPGGLFGGIAIAFKSSGVVLTEAACGDCPGPHLLELIPGFSDLPDSVLEADDPAFSLHVGEIAFNATFGMVRCETFVCPYKHGDIVDLPQSCWDGYKYSRDELLYLWGVKNSTDPSTNWISGPDSLWFSNWNVKQTTGEVFCEEWYERSSTADSRLAAKSNDGLLLVYVIGQRQRTNMIMSATASYTTIDETKMATDKPYTQLLAQSLSKNAKFSCVNSEVFYLGEYTNGQTVKLPISSVDGYAYSVGECKFQHSWRWTASESSYVQPPGNYEQAAPFLASINSSGVVSITVKFETNGGEDLVTASGYGRIAAFAFCKRSATPSSGTLADDFTELDLGFFFPGRTVRASELLTIKHNIDEAILSPEFFGPTDYADAATVPTPVSPVDGYAYSRSELQYIWEWSDTTNGGGSHLRLPLFVGNVDASTGLVKLRTWRLPPGGPFVDDDNTKGRIRVLTMANRQAIHPILESGPTDGNSPADGGSVVTDNANYTVNGT